MEEEAFIWRNEELINEQQVHAFIRMVMLAKNRIELLNKTEM